MNCNLLQNMLKLKKNEIITTWIERDRDPQHGKRWRTGSERKDIHPLVIYFILGKLKGFFTYSHWISVM